MTTDNSVAFIRTVSRPIRMAFGYSEDEAPAFFSTDLPIEAQATDDGKVYLSLGLLANADSDDELAAALAHEMAHIACGHIDSYREQSATDTVTYATTIGLILGRLAGGGISVWAGQTVFDQFRSAGFSRKQEAQADLVGIDALIRAGYQPSGMVALLSRLRGRATPGLDNPLAGSTHPSPSERLNSVFAYLRIAYPSLTERPRKRTTLDRLLRAEYGYLSGLIHLHDAETALRYPSAALGYPQLVGDRSGTAKARRALQLSVGEAKPSPTEVAAGVLASVPEPNDPAVQTLKTSWPYQWVVAEIQARDRIGATSKFEPSAIINAFAAVDAPELDVAMSAMVHVHFKEYAQAKAILDANEQRFGIFPVLLPLRVAVANRLPKGRLNVGTPEMVACIRQPGISMLQFCSDAEKNPDGEFNRWWKFLSTPGVL